MTETERHTYTRKGVRFVVDGPLLKRKTADTIARIVLIERLGACQRWIVEDDRTHVQCWNPLPCAEHP